MPCPARHRTPVSDAHAVCSHPVTPIRTPAVYSAIPIPSPCTVTLADPVPTRLVLLAKLIAPMPAVNASVRLPT
eukprot:1918889-Rhodomonas_salina.1